MENVDLNIILKNNELEKKTKIKGIFDKINNILTYCEDNIEYTFNFNKNILVRENNEFLMKIDFSQKENGLMTIFYKELSKEFLIDIAIKELKKSDNLFIIKYIINDMEFLEYHVEIIN